VGLELISLSPGQDSPLSRVEVGGPGWPLVNSGGGFLSTLNPDHAGPPLFFLMPVSDPFPRVTTLGIFLINFFFREGSRH